MAWPRPEGPPITVTALDILTLSRRLPHNVSRQFIINEALRVRINFLYIEVRAGCGSVCGELRQRIDNRRGDDRNWRFTASRWLFKPTTGPAIFANPVPVSPSILADDA